MRKFNILVVKESRAGEKRVSLLPEEVKKLVKAGHRVFVETGAGEGIAIADSIYEYAGASIRSMDNIHCFKSLFHDINLIVRAKRAAHAREIEELDGIEKGTIMVGALDPKEPRSQHIAQYKKNGILGYSLDYLNVPATSTLNILAMMSEITGRLAIQGAINQFSGTVTKVVIVGYGTAGKSALKEAITKKIKTTVFCTRKAHQEEIQAAGAQAIIIDKQASIEQTQQQVCKEIINADIVITAARSANKQSPLIIPVQTQNKMMTGSIIVDLALSDGGNVEGAEHDMTLTTKNGVSITNASGYPKIVPKEASEKWSQASLAFIEALSSADPITESARIC